MKKVIVINGPTASGKTDLSIRIAQMLGTEIISYDSRQFYHEMSIGTARPDAELLAKVPHHFIGHLKVHDAYSVFKFEQDALNTIDHIFKEKDVVVLTGGSGLYLDAAIRGMDDIPDPDPVIREKLIGRFENGEIEVLKRELSSLDPVYYNQIDQQNPKRILRGLEVCLTTGKPFSELRSSKPAPRPFETHMMILDWPRQTLYERIDRRTLNMFDQGLVEEAAALLPMRHLNALNTVGYKELFLYFDGSIDLNEAKRLIQRNTRHYAKRQITWNKKYHNALVIHPDHEAEIMLWVQQVMRSHA